MTEGELRKMCRELNIPVMHKNARGWLVAPCPFAPYLHEFGTDRNPSFNLHVNDDGYSGFNCFTCGQRGNLTKLINKLGDLRGKDYQKLSTRTLINETPEDFKDFDAVDAEMLDEREISPIEQTIYLRMYPLASETPEAVEYLKSRKVTRHAAELLDLRYDPDQRRTLFPVYDWEKKLYGFTGRSILSDDEIAALNSKAYRKVKDYAGLPKDALLLGEHLARDGYPMLVVEGLFALLHVVSRGACEYSNPVATMGSHLSDTQRDRLADHDAPVFMLYDNDKAGREGLWGPQRKDGSHEGGGAIDKLRPHVPVLTCTYPDGVDDPDDLDDFEIKAMVAGDWNEPC